MHVFDWAIVGLRNQTKKHNNSSLENPDMIAQTKDRQQKHEESEQYGLQFNKDNLSYIEGLINTKQNHVSIIFIS
jgi:hypothetical protein